MSGTQAPDAGNRDQRRWDSAVFPTGRKVQKRGGEPRLLGQREEGLEYELRGSKREDGWLPLAGLRAGYSAQRA